MTSKVICDGFSIGGTVRTWGMIFLKILIIYWLNYIIRKIIYYLIENVEKNYILFRKDFQFSEENILIF